MMVPANKQHEHLQLLNVFTGNRYAQCLSTSLMRIYVGVSPYICTVCNLAFQWDVQYTNTVNYLL